MISILEEVRGAKTIGISGHIRPDGDCIGAAVAMYLYLHKEVKGAKVKLFLEQPSDVFACIKGTDKIQKSIDTSEKFDVFIALDCSGDRMGDADTLYAKAGRKINIDHHISNYGTGDVNYVVPTASSTSELVYNVIDKDKIDKDIAEAIYMGIVHDTGIFQYSNTSPETLQIAAKLIGYGFDFTTLIDKTFFEKTYIQNQIMGRALLESMLLLSGQCIVSVIDQKTMKFYGADSHDFEGVVNQLRMIKGVDCAIFMYQTGTLEYKVSMRSNKIVDVAKVAQMFGGGGHVRAAGCTMSGTYQDVVNNLSLHIEKQLRENTCD